MPRRALIDHRPFLVASLVAGISYFFVSDDPIDGLWLMIWKGAGVGLLAAYAALRGHGREGALIAIVMALGAIADMVLEIDMTIGGAIFALGHVVAIGLYLTHRRHKATASQTLAAAALLVLTPVIAYALVAHLPGATGVAVYALLVGAMAGAAWKSRYPRYRTGIGAVMFAVSDLLIFARMGGHFPEAVTGWLIWPLYYFGQFLIVTGVIRTNRHGRV